MPASSNCAASHSSDQSAPSESLSSLSSLPSPKLQLRTVRELMDGLGIERPTISAALDETFKKAPESKKKHGHQKEFGL